MVVEDRSTSTLENTQYAAQMLGPASRVLVVTDIYHVFRAQRVFGQAFATADGTGSLAPIDARTMGAMREVLAIAYYTARGRMPARLSQEPRPAWGLSITPTHQG